jgi:hypothetical protein
VAARQFALVAGQPCGLGDAVEFQRRLVERQPGDRRERPCRLDRDEGADAEPEDVVRPGAVKERVQVLDLFAGAVILAVRAAHAAAAPARDIDGEPVAEGRGQAHEVLRGLASAVQQDDAGTVAGPAVPDRRAIRRRDRAGYG